MRETSTRRGELATQRDRRWFLEHPGRRTYCRLAGELEEMELRQDTGNQAPGWPLIAVRKVGAGVRMRRLHIVPAIEERELVIPTGEDDCAAVFETELLELRLVGAERLAVQGSLERPHLPTVREFRRLQEALEARGSPGWRI